MRNKKNIKLFLIYLSTFLPMLFWGISYIWTKIVLKYYDPLTTIFLRLIISSIFLTIAILFIKTKKIKKEDMKFFFLLAFFEPFCYFLGENFGINLVSPTVASIIISTIPVVTPVFAYLIIKEKLTKLNIIGLIISFTGVIIVLTAQNSEFSVSIKGVLLLFFAVLSGVGYGIMVKGLSQKYSPIKIVYTQNLIGAFYFLPLFLIFEFKDFITVTPNKELIVAILQLSLFASTIAFVLITIAIKNLGINKTNVFTNLIPVITVIFSFILLGKKPGIQEIIGILIVILGLFLSQIRKRKLSEKAIVHEDI